jgi:hypothetical protein
MLRKIADDLIERVNVHKFDGIEKLKQNLDVSKATVKEMYLEAEDHFLDHFEQLA